MTQIKNIYPAANSWHTYIESRPVNSNIRSARLLRDFDRLVSIIQRMRSNMYSNQHYGDRHTIGASIAKHRYNGLIASELTNNITPVHKLILYLHNGASSADILFIFYIAFLDRIYIYVYIYIHSFRIFDRSKITRRSSSSFPIEDHLSPLPPRSIR